MQRTLSCCRPRVPWYPRRHGDGRRFAAQLSADTTRRSGGRLPRHQGRRPLPLAGRRRPQVDGGRRLGRGREQGHLRLPQGAFPQRDAIQKRLTELWNYEKLLRPVQGRRPLLLHARTTACKTSPSSTRRTRLDGEPRVLLDPNSGPRTAPWPWPAWRSATTASTWPTASPRPAPTGRPGTSSTSPPASRCADELKWVKFSGAAWTPDGKGFFYSRYPEPKAGEKFQSLNLNQKLYYHRLGTPQGEDVLVYKRPDHPDWSFGGDVTEDGRYLVIAICDGTDHRNRVAYKRPDRAATAMPVDLIDNFDNEYSFIGNDGPVFYFKTDLERAARPGHRHRHPQARARPTGKRSSPRRRRTCSGVGLVGNLFVANYLKDAHTQVKLFTTGRRASSARSSCPASARRPASAASAPTPRRSTPSPASPRRRASTATTWSPARARCSARPR